MLQIHCRDSIRRELLKEAKSKLEWQMEPRQTLKQWETFIWNSTLALL
jgi:hypothetical protein